MNLSIFDVVGPVMVGPSSSHTAGAARLARVARQIVNAPFRRVSFGLNGSFAQTHKGHGTDRALVAGALGLRQDDERLADAFTMAREAGLAYDFHEVELQDLHENSVEMRFFLEDGGVSTITGSSVGGGRIVINSINGFATEFTAESSTLIVRQRDKKGIVSEITQLLAENDINIGVMRLSRMARGGTACCIIETDTPLPAILVERVAQINGVELAQALNLDAEEGACV